MTEDQKLKHRFYQLPIKTTFNNEMIVRKHFVTVKLRRSDKNQLHRLILPVSNGCHRFASVLCGRRSLSIKRAD